jgi:aldehyde dehydrogenase (NAD+)
MATNVTTMKLPAARLAAGPSMESIIARGREAQARWSGVPLPTRLSVIRNARHAIAARAEELASTLAPELNRNIADTLVAEVLPLAEACRFLERESPRL